MTKKQIQKLARKLAEISFKEGKILEPQAVKSIKFLKTLPNIGAIEALGEYLKNIKRMERQHTMYIESSIHLTLDSIQNMKEIVEKKMKITKVITSINPEMLGGFKLRVGDEIWDESILGKINQVQEAIIKSK